MITIITDDLLAHPDFNYIDEFRFEPTKVEDGLYKFNNKKIGSGYLIPIINNKYIMVYNVFEENLSYKVFCKKYSHFFTNNSSTTIDSVIVNKENERKFQNFQHYTYENKFDILLWEGSKPWNDSNKNYFSKVHLVLISHKTSEGYDSGATLGTAIIIDATDIDGELPN